MVIHGLRHVDASRLRKRLDPRRNVDAVAENIAALGDDIAEIDSDPHRDALFVRHRLVSSHCRVAQGTSTARRFDDAVELDQYQITGLFEDISIEFRDQWFDDLGQKGPQPGKAVLLVTGEQPAVAGYQNRCEPAPDAPSRILRHDSCTPIARCGNDAPHFIDYMRSSSRIARFFCQKMTACLEPSPGMPKIIRLPSLGQVRLS